VCTAVCRFCLIYLTLPVITNCWSRRKCRVELRKIVYLRAHCRLWEIGQEVSCSLHTGTYADGIARSSYSVVPGTGTGELMGLRGHGAFSTMRPEELHDA